MFSNNKKTIKNQNINKSIKISINQSKKEITNQFHTHDVRNWS